MTNIDGLEKALEIMENTRDAMSNTVMESISYKESYNKDGISFDINGQGFVRNLKFANGTPPSMIENAINSTIEKVKLHFEEIYFNNLPLEIRQEALDKSPRRGPRHVRPGRLRQRRLRQRHKKESDA